MKKLVTGTLVLCLFLSVPVIAQAEINIADSLEWMTVDCEMIVKGKVTAVDIAHSCRHSVHEGVIVTVTVQEVLKSEYKGTTISFRWLPYSRENYNSASGWQKSGHDMLFFLIKGDPKRDRGCFKGSWILRKSRTAVIDLDNPGKSVITADFKVLKESKAILKAVRARVSLIKHSSGKSKKLELGRKPKAFGPQQGFIRLEVPGSSQAWGTMYRDSACYLIVPPDYQYKTLAMQLCKSKDVDERVSGVQMLCNFPDREVIELLKAYLSDSTETKYGDGKKVVKIVYPIRKAAYESLLILGEKFKIPVLEQTPAEKEALQILRKACVKNPDKGDVSRAENLFKNLEKDVAVSVIRQVLSEDCSKDVPLWFIQRFIDDRSVIPAVIEIARKKKGSLRLRAVSIFRKIPDKRALQVLMEVLLYDDQKYYHRDELHEMYVTSIFINSAMAIHALTEGEVGIKPSKRDFVDSKAEGEIDKNKKEIIEKCEKWWKENKKKVLEGIEKEKSEKEALQVLMRVFAGNPGKGDYGTAAWLFQKRQQSFLVPIIKKVIKEATRKDSLLGYIYRYIDDRSIIPDIIDVASSEKGWTRLRALKILRKIPDKRALPVIIEKCLHDPYKSYYEDEFHRMQVRSLFINSLMALHTLTNGEIGIKPPKRDVSDTIEARRELEIDKKKKEILEKCEKWWKENKKKVLEEIKQDDKQSRIKEAFELYSKGDTPQLLKQPHDIVIAVYKEALDREGLIEKTLSLILFCKLEVNELAQDIIRIASEKSGRLRLLAVRVFSEKLPDKRAVPVLIEKCLDDDYMKMDKHFDVRGGLEITVDSVLYESAHALYLITEGKIGVKSHIRTLSSPGMAVNRLEIEEFPEKAKKWWSENKEEFLKEIEKEEKQNRIDKAFKLYSKGDTPQLLKQSHEVRIAVLRKALSEVELKKEALRLVLHGRFDARELAPDIIKVARDETGYLRLLAVRILYKRIPDKRAVPVLIEHCLDDDYEKTHERFGRHGLDIKVDSVFYDSAHALYIITNGKIGAKSPIHDLSNPDWAVDGLKSDGVPAKIKKWWKANKDEFLKEIEKEYGTTDIGSPEKKSPEKKKPKKQNP